MMAMRASNCALQKAEPDVTETKLHVTCVEPETRRARSVCGGGGPTAIPGSGLGAIETCPPFRGIYYQAGLDIRLRPPHRCAAGPDRGAAGAPRRPNW
jgi:hypothetical protein